MLTKAYATQSPTASLAPLNIERRNVGPSDVGIEIHYCGICHSDIHTARDEWGGTMYPCVPGHEIVGKVTAVGANVEKFVAGDIVGVGCMVGSCRKCKPCEKDQEQYCENGFVGTYNGKTEEGHTLGGYSQYIVVDQNYVLNIPENLDLPAVAPLLCAGITTYSPLCYLDVKKGDRVGVMGLGGLGHMGVKIAASFGAEVTVISHSEHKRSDAKRLGAHHFLNMKNTEEARPRLNYFDVILDTISAEHDVSLAVGMLKPEGNLVMLGAPEKPIELGVFALIFGRKKIMGSLIGGIRETQEMLDHCARHNIVSDIELIKPDQINLAYERTLKSDVKYRFVIDCQKM